MGSQSRLFHGLKRESGESSAVKSHSSHYQHAVKRHLRPYQARKTRPHLHRNQVRDSAVDSHRRGRTPPAPAQPTSLRPPDAGLCPPDQTPPLLGRHRGDHVGDHAPRPIGLDLPDAPVGDVDRRTVVGTGVEKLLSEKAIPRDPGNLPDHHVLILLTLNRVDELLEFVAVPSFSEKMWGHEDERSESSAGTTLTRKPFRPQEMAGRTTSGTRHRRRASPRRRTVVPWQPSRWR